MKRATLRAFKCRLGVHRPALHALVWAGGEPVDGISMRCVDCGAPADGDFAEQEGIRRHHAGESVCFSTGIHGLMTFGYGHLDAHGFWQFPLPYAYLSRRQKALVDECDRKAESCQ
jgi:hypothetical protein